MLDDATKAKTLGRLRRIEGQVQGLQRMIGNDAYCVDILLQISAVQGALDQVQKLLLARALRPNFAEWEATVQAPLAKLAVRAEDTAGNVAIAVRPVNA